jgi:hypothetical protein
MDRLGHCELRIGLLPNPRLKIQHLEQRGILQYGSQLVPLPKKEEDALKYCPEKGFQVIGSAPMDAVPRHLYFKVASLCPFFENWVHVSTR